MPSPAKKREPMIVLHSLWTGSALGVWGEDSELAAAPCENRISQPSTPHPLPHPFALSHSKLRMGLDMLVRSFHGKLGAEEEMVLRLPSGPRGPHPSLNLRTTAKGPPLAKEDPEWPHGASLA